MATLKSKMEKMSPERREKIEAGAAEIIASNATLTQLREFLDVTQTEIGDILDVGQDNISRLEKRGNNMKISTLSAYVEALGGELTISAKFPDKGIIELQS